METVIVWETKTVSFVRRIVVIVPQFVACTVVSWEKIVKTVQGTVANVPWCVENMVVSQANHVKIVPRIVVTVPPKGVVMEFVAIPKVVTIVFRIVGSVA